MTASIASTDARRIAYRGITGIDAVAYPLDHIPPDEQLAFIAGSMPGLHDDDRHWLHTASALWTALEVLRADGRPMTWAAHTHQTATAFWLASGGASAVASAHDLAAAAVRRLAGWLRHIDSDGRAVEITSPPFGAPWWAWTHRARQFTPRPMPHGPAHWTPTTPSRPAGPAQLTLTPDLQEAPTCPPA